VLGGEGGGREHKDWVEDLSLIPSIAKYSLKNLNNLTTTTKIQSVYLGHLLESKAFFSFFVCVVLGVKLRASLISALPLEPCPSPSPFFASVIFQIGSCTFCLGPALDLHPFTYASHIAEIKGMNHHDWLVC
jgi:hypothetical protein